MLTHHPRKLDSLLANLDEATGSDKENLPRSYEVLSRYAEQFARLFGDVHVAGAALRRRPELVHVFRGDNPELRPLVRLALAEAFADEGGLALLGELAEDVLPVPVLDLTPGALAAQAGPVAHTAIRGLVEYVDRSGGLRQFLDAAVAVRPDVEFCRSPP